MPTDDDWLERAVALATENVAAGGGPFGAIVVSADGTLLAEGRNRVTADLDPTAHAEVVAIRAACRAVGDFSLAGATVYSSCEPCPMCLTTAMWARTARVVYAADRHDAERGGFDDRAFYDLLEVPRDEWTAPRVEGRRIPGSARPFEAWAAHAERTDY